MKKIKWTYPYDPKCAYAKVGCIVMHCYLRRSVPRIGTPTDRWYGYASISIREHSETFRTGPIRKSMAKAKDDAVQLARELLLDYHTCLMTEMANFDLTE